MANKIILLSIIVVFLFLAIYGIDWGLPSRWCVDESVAEALRMISEKSIIPKADYDHPTFHHFVLITFFIPVLAFLKIIAYPLSVVKEAASFSWIYLSNVDPKFCRLVYIVARLSSAFFAALTIYLSYRIAEKCFSKRAGIFSALFLSVTMGFVSEVHTAKSTALFIFMVMLTLFSCIWYLDKKTPRKYIIPFFLGGLSLACKYSGGIVIFPLTYYLLKIADKKKLKYSCIAIFIFLIGFFVGFPGIFAHFFNYFNSAVSYQARYMPQSIYSAPSLFISGVAGYTLLLKDIFGMPLFLLIVLGIVFFLGKTKSNDSVKILLFTLVPYLMFFSLSPRPFEVKYIILAVPIFIILSSGIIDNIFRLKIFYKRLIIFLLISTWFISLKYTIACKDIYAYTDIRYKVTDWIEGNIQKGERIVIIGLPGWVVHNRLFKDYSIFLIRRGDNDYVPANNRHFTKGKQRYLTSEEVDRVIDDLNKDHDYFVVYPVFSMRDRKDIFKRKYSIENSGIELKNQAIIKEFTHERGSLFGEPGIGGYEPKRIVITYGRK